MTKITDPQVWKMLDAWYQLIGRRIAPTEAERARDFAAMNRSIEAFESNHEGKNGTSPPIEDR